MVVILYNGLSYIKEWSMYSMFVCKKYKYTPTTELSSNWPLIFKLIFCIGDAEVVQFMKDNFDGHRR